jgi:hypothetical protein
LIHDLIFKEERSSLTMPASSNAEFYLEGHSPRIILPRAIELLEVSGENMTMGEKSRKGISLEEWPELEQNLPGIPLYCQHFPEKKSLHELRAFDF